MYLALLAPAAIGFAGKPPGDGTTATGNTSVGSGALANNTTGQSNTATGSQALFTNTTASGNTANGFLALFSNSTGAANTAIGSQALNFNTVGNENTSLGVNALFSNTTGNDNTINGANAAHNNTTGGFNTVSGVCALYSNTAGSYNIAFGSLALNKSTGNSNIGLGYNAGSNLTTGDLNIDIGNQGVAGESGTIRIGTQGSHLTTFIAGINNTAVAGLPVVIDANGQLGISGSSERFKQDVQPMDSASETVLKLKPVTFEYKDRIDPAERRQFGLIAEEVAKVDPDLIVRDRDGKILTVRYDAVNAMLLNEFLKEHRKVEVQERRIAELTSQLADQKRAFNEALSEQHAQIAKIAGLVQQQGSELEQVQTHADVSFDPSPVENSDN